VQEVGQLLHRLAEGERELALARRQMRLFATDLPAPADEAHRRRTREIQAIHRDTISRLMRAARFRDDETGTHLVRISRLSAILARELGLSEKRVRSIETAAALHDIGKIGVEDAILHKPGPLDAGEWERMKRHTLLGAELLAGSSSPLLELGREIALHHHECWDGSGYPYGLRGEEIPLPARIVMICDVYDALRSERPYKPAYDHDTVCGILLEGDGRTRPEHFDPKLLDLFRRSHRRFEVEWRALRHEEEYPVLAELCA
jgi:putative two-component system response regulator